MIFCVDCKRDCKDDNLLEHYSDEHNQWHRLIHEGKVVFEENGEIWINE